jgi:signal transduction histidine kinase
MAESLEQSRVAIARESEERLALERRLRETEKLAAIGNLAAGLAHEIAAPLNVISGRAELMLRREPEQPVRQQNLAIIVRQIRRITTIVRNLLDFAKRREPRLRPVVLDDAAESALELLEGELIRAGVEVRRERNGDPSAQADPDLLHQVLVNLILNAAQAMEANEGERVLTVRLQHAPACDGDPAAVCLEIQDTGPGLSDEAMASIFQPFYTTKVRGTGLGLVVARRIAEEHGGSLDALNGAGGATFRLRLPAASGDGASSG